MSTPQDPNKKDQPLAKAKHIRPVNISIPVHTGMNIRKQVKSDMKVIINSFAPDIRKRPDYYIRFLDYLSKHPNNTSCRDNLLFHFGSAFLGLVFFEADIVDADPYMRSSLLNLYFRFVEKQIKAMTKDPKDTEEKDASKSKKSKAADSDSDSDGPIALVPDDGETYKFTPQQLKRVVIYEK